MKASDDIAKLDLVSLKWTWGARHSFEISSFKISFNRTQQVDEKNTMLYNLKD